MCFVFANDWLSQGCVKMPSPRPSDLLCSISSVRLNEQWFTKKPTERSARTCQNRPSAQVIARAHTETHEGMGGAFHSAKHISMHAHSVDRGSRNNFR
jgi:hypothetical protein